MEVSLKQIQHAEIVTISGIELSAREEDFAGGSMTAIAGRLKARPNSEDCLPFLIMADCKIAGFLMLRKGQALPDWAAPDAVSLHNFRISGNMQGRGCGTTAVVRAARWIATHWPQASKLMLSVNVDNFAARGFYLRCGFQETTESHNGRLGVEHIMSCRVSDLMRESL
ncbi:GNAT family N-acetyltransferase (plasmid) [Aquamicrobium terrae]